MNPWRGSILVLAAAAAVAVACSVNPQPLPPTDPVDDGEEDPVGDPPGGFNADGKTSDAGASPTAEGGGDGGDGGDEDGSPGDASDSG